MTLEAARAAANERLADPWVADDSGIFMRADHLRALLAAAERPAPLADADLRKKANNAYYAMIAEAGENGGWYGFSHQRDAYDQGYMDGHRAAEEANG
jgi:hypothetical protein